MKNCIKCGKQLQDDDVFCGKCGARQIAQSVERPPRYSGHSEVTKTSLLEYISTLTTIKYVVGIITLIIGIVLLIYSPFYNQMQDTTSSESVSGGMGSHDHSYFGYFPGNGVIYNIMGLIFFTIGIYYLTIAHIEGKTLQKYIRKDL